MGTVSFLSLFCYDIGTWLAHILYSKNLEVVSGLLIQIQTKRWDVPNQLTVENVPQIDHEPKVLWRVTWHQILHMCIASLHLAWGPESQDSFYLYSWKLGFFPSTF